MKEVNREKGRETEKQRVSKRKGEGFKKGGPNKKLRRKNRRIIMKPRYRRT